MNFSPLCAMSEGATPISAAVITIVTTNVRCVTVTSRAVSLGSRGRPRAPRESLSLRPMDAALDAEFLQMVRHRLLDEFPGQVRACLDALGEDDLWWRPNDQANAVGNLVLHLAGSNQFYLGHAIGGGPDVRDREAEFGGARSAVESRRVGVYDAARATSAARPRYATPARMIETTMATGRSSSFARILMHVTHHNALHIGQIVWVTKLRKPGALNELLRGGPPRT